jgi:very-short-patch-repair endonuclease
VTDTDEWLFHLACDHLAEQARTAVRYEHRFHPKRRWRFDAAFPERKIAVEIDGGVFVQGRHTRGVGYKNDCEKFNAAALLNWRVFHFLPEQIHSEMVNVLHEALKGGAV